MENSSPKSNPGNWIPSAAILAVVGVGLGLALGKSGSEAPVQDVIRNVSLGFVWAFILLQWVDIIGQAVALLSDPVGKDLNMADRSAVTEKADGMRRNPEVVGRSANLLQAWGGALNPQALIELAAFQSSRSRKPVLSGTVFGFVVLYALGLSASSSVIIWGAGVLLGLTLLVKLSLLSRVDAYLESRVLSRLPGNLPNTAMTADELAGAIGGSIEKAFDQYIPKPDAMASAIQGGIEDASKAIAAQGAAVASALEGVQSGFQGGVEEASKAIAAQGAAVASALEGVPTGFVGSLEGVQSGFVGSLEGVRSGLVGSFSGAGKEAVEQLNAALASQSERLESTSQSLVSQIEKLVDVEKNIENLLNVQKSVEDTLHGVSASKQWQDTLAALTTHLSESDKLLKEAAKPRMITLVEED